MFKQENCLSLNFGVTEKLPYQQVIMTLESKQNQQLPLKLKHLDAPSQCFHVFIGKKYLKKMDEVVVKVKEVGRLLGGKPIALFVLGSLKKLDLETIEAYTDLVPHNMVGLKSKCNL